MKENPYNFQYCGVFDESSEVSIPLNTDPNTVRLYQGRSPREVIIDFPAFIGPLPEQITEPCGAKLSLEEVREMNKIVGKQIFTNKDTRPCQGIKKLKNSVWEYDCMGLHLRTRFPIPYYKCGKCEDLSDNYGYLKMRNYTIVFILGDAAVKHHHEDPDVMFASIHT